MTGYLELLQSSQSRGKTPTDQVENKQDFKTRTTIQSRHSSVLACLSQYCYLHLFSLISPSFHILSHTATSHPYKVFKVYKTFLTKWIAGAGQVCWTSSLHELWCTQRELAALPHQTQPYLGSAVWHRLQSRRPTEQLNRVTDTSERK